MCAINLLLVKHISSQDLFSVPTNPQAEGQTRINFQISEDEKAALQILADASGMKLSAYIRRVLIEEGVNQHTIYETKAVRQKQQLSLVADEQKPYDAPPNRHDAAGEVLKARASRPAKSPTAPKPTPPVPPKESSKE